MKMNVFIVCFLFFCGCSKPGRLEFVEMVRNHRDITKETNSAVVLSIQDELNSRTDLNAEQRQSIQDLIDRLILIERQSDLIFEYENNTIVDQNLISELIRSKWKKENK